MPVYRHTLDRRAWQRGLLRAIRRAIPRPPTSGAVLPALLEAAGLLEPSQARPAAPDQAPPQAAGGAASSSDGGGGSSGTLKSGTSSSESSSSSSGKGSSTRRQPLSASPLALTEQQALTGPQQAHGGLLAQAAAAGRGGGAAHGPSDEVGVEELLAALPPRAAESVWLAAFIAELKVQWGFPRRL